MRRLTRFLTTALPICLPTLNAYRLMPFLFGSAFNPSTGLYHRFPSRPMAANSLSPESRRRLSKAMLLLGSSCLSTVAPTAPGVRPWCSCEREIRAPATGVFVWADKFALARGLLLSCQIIPDYHLRCQLILLSVHTHEVKKQTLSVNQMRYSFLY